MIFIHDIVGSADFEFTRDGLVIAFKAGNEHTDEMVDVCISQWAIESLQSAVLRSLDVIMASHFGKEVHLTGSLTPGAE